MNVNVRTHIGVNLNGVETVVPKVVVSQGQIDFARNDGAAVLGVETNVEVGIFENVHRLVRVDLTEMDVPHTNANAALVFSTWCVVVRGRVVVERLAAVGLVKAARRVGVGQAHGVRSGDAGQGKIA